MVGELSSLRMTGGSELAYNDATFNPNLPRAGYGGALAVFGGVGEVLIDSSSRLQYNRATLSGGAIAISLNLGLFLLAGGSSLSHNFVRNVETGEGGAVLVEGRAANITLARGAVVYNNTAPTWGGAFRIKEETGVFLMYNSTASANGGYGGGLFFTAGDCDRVAVVDSTLAGNHGDGGEGGAFNIQGSLGAFMLQRSGAASHRGSYGGVLFVFEDAEDILLDGATVTDSAVTNAYGGAIFVYGATRRLSIVGNCSILRNTANMGGAVASRMGFGFVHISDSVLAFNQATSGSGGAIFGGHYWHWRDAEPTALLVEGSRLYNNTATRSGGAITLVGEVRSAVFRGAILTGNTAVDGGGCLAVLGTVGEVVLEAGTVGQGNRAGAMGGFLSVSAPDDLTGVLLRSLVLRGGSRLEGNVAGRLGGAVAAPLLGRVEVTEGSSLSGNSAAEGAGGAVAERAAVVSAALECVSFEGIEEAWFSLHANGLSFSSNHVNALRPPLAGLDTRCVPGVPPATFRCGVAL